MLKIGTVYTLYGRRAGAELYFEKILKGMVEAFSDIEFFVYCNSEAYNVIPENRRVIKKRITWLKNQFCKAFWLEFIAPAVINKQNFDVFWIPSGTNSFPGPWRAKNIVTFLDFGEYFVGTKYDFKRMIYRKLICIPRSLKRANGVTTISRTTAKDLKRLFPKVTQEPIAIYLGPSPRRTVKDIENPENIVALESGVSLKRIVLVAGRTDYIGKGLDTLLTAYQRFSNNGNNIPRLVLVGSPGENHNELLRSISDLGLNGKAMYLGRVSDRCVDALYALADMVILASRYEGFGFPILEAWEHGVPLICSNGGSIPEISGDAAIRFKVGDANALAEAMNTLYGNKALQKDLITKGKKRLELFSWDNCFNEMKKMFLELALQKTKQ